MVLGETVCSLLFFTFTVYTLCLPVSTWRGAECKKTAIHHECPHTSVRPTQSEKSWSCDCSCCRVDCGGGGGPDAEGGELRAVPLWWVAASARSCRNLSKSERHSSEHKSKQEALSCFVFPVLERRRGTFTGHPLAHRRLFILGAQTQQHNTRSDHHLFT